MTDPTPSKSADLAAMRSQLGATQAEFSTAMGMPLRSYQDIEAGRNPVRPVHIVAAQAALISMVADGAPVEVLSPELQVKIIGIAQRLSNEASTNT